MEYTETTPQIFWEKKLQSVPSSEIPIRLRKILMLYTFLSNKEIKIAYDSGRISILSSQEKKENPKLKGLDGLKSVVFPDDVILLDGKELEKKEIKRSYIAFNKPEAGFITSSENEGQEWKKHEGLGKWLSKMPEGTSAIGRLDKETTGLLLLSNDGDFNNGIRLKSRGIVKEYEITVTERIESEQDSRLQSMLKGVDILIGIARAVAVSFVECNQNYSIFRIQITEGRKHVVRKMCKSVKLNLTHLHRVRIGNIELGKLETGEFRYLSETEVAQLWEMMGGLTLLNRNRIIAMAIVVIRCRNEKQPFERLEQWFQKHKLEPQIISDLFGDKMDYEQETDNQDFNE